MGGQINLEFEKAMKKLKEQFEDKPKQSQLDKFTKKRKFYKVTCSFSGVPEHIKAISREEAERILKENICDPFCDESECNKQIEEEKE